MMGRKRRVTSRRSGLWKLWSTAGSSQTRVGHDRDTPGLVRLMAGSGQTQLWVWLFTVGLWLRPSWVSLWPSLWVGNVAMEFPTAVFNRGWRWFRDCWLVQGLERRRNGWWVGFVEKSYIFNPISYNGFNLCVKYILDAAKVVFYTKTKW